MMSAAIDDLESSGPEVEVCLRSLFCLRFMIKAERKIVGFALCPFRSHCFGIPHVFLSEVVLAFFNDIFIWE